VNARIYNLKIWFKSVVPLLNYRSFSKGLFYWRTLYMLVLRTLDTDSYIRYKFEYIHTRKNYWGIYASIFGKNCGVGSGKKVHGKTARPVTPC